MKRHETLPMSQRPQRDLRLDVFRGLALAMIFINHVPGTIYEHFTNRNFGFSDAAEGFVIMSGIAAALAYGAVVRRDGVAAGFRRCVARVFTLYWVHIVTTVLALAIAAGAARFFGLTQMMEVNNIQIFLEDLTGGLIGVPLLTHQLGYFNILPLYCALLLIAPAAIVLGQRAPLALLAVSGAVWFAAGIYRLNFPNFPTPGGWFFNPFSWQVLFVVGLLTGLAMKEGRRFVPVRPRLFWLACAYLLFSVLWIWAAPVQAVGRDALAALENLGLPFHFTTFDKTFVALPRLLHVLALLYVISCLPAIRQICHSRAAAPLALVGAHALPVFALGCVLSILGQAIKAHSGTNFVVDTHVIFIGLAAQLLLAMLLEQSGQKRAGLAAGAMNEMPRDAGPEFIRSRAAK